SNSYGEVGEGTTVGKLIPVQTKVLTGVLSIAAGVNHNLAITVGGLVWSWGRNEQGQLGDGVPSTSKLLPARVSALGTAVAVAAGGDHSHAILADRSLWSWGGSANGQLGTGLSLIRAAPVQVW
ncbi:RCC1 domain-containing protein, partial [Myxococcus sp. CA039A]|nr:hypothetical protein [Myxococcus sp. CA039A]